MLELKEPRDFKAWAREQDLDETYFPYAQNGPRYRQSAGTWTATACGFGVVYLILRVMIPKLPGLFPDFDPGFMRRVLELAGNLTTMIGGIGVIVAVLAVCMWARYYHNVLRRSQSFERDIRANDKQAILLKKEMVKRFSITRKIADIKRKEAQEKKSRSGSNSSGSFMWRRSLDDEDMLAMLNAIKNMEVHINSRQELGSSEVMTLSVIDVTLPASYSGAEKTKQELEHYGTTASGITADNKGLNQVKFSSRIDTPSGSKSYFTAKSLSEDKYALPSEESVKVEKIEYRPSIPFSMFVDRTPKIQAAAEAAQRFMDSTAIVVDSLLVTLGISAQLESKSRGATTAAFNYDLAAGTKLDNVQSLPDVLNKNMGVVGCDALIQGKTLLVSIPFPKEACSPIDCTQLYKEAFF